MLRTPRFIIPADKNDSDQSHVHDVEFTNTESIQIESSEVKALGFKSYAVVNEAVTPTLIEFVTKIFNSIARQDVQIINQWSEDAGLKALKNVFEHVPSQDLDAYMQMISDFKNSYSNENLGLVINFQEGVVKTQALISEPWICISTYCVQDILTQPPKKAEFWNFLKHLKF